MKKIASFFTVFTILTFSTLPAFPTAHASFTDVPDNHPFKAAIEYVKAQGIVSGYPDGSYKPEDKIDRAAFAKIVMSARFSAADIDSCVVVNGFYNKPIFNDLESGAWYEKFFCMAKKMAVMKGYSDGSVKPTSKINLAEAAKILVLSYSLTVRDAAAGEAWYVPYIEKLQALSAIPDSLMAITDPGARANKEITRGEMADMIYRLRTISDSVVSDDGSLSLRIPQSSLPAGVDLKSLSIKKVAAADNPVQEVNGAPMEFYKMEPDGLVFTKPVQFTLTTATQANTVPMIFLVSGDNFDVIPDPVIDVNQEKQVAVLSGELNHFSEVGLGNLPLSVAITAAGSHEVGAEPFAISSQITGSSTLPSFTFGKTQLTVSGVSLDQKGTFMSLGDKHTQASPSGADLGDTPITASANATCSAGADSTNVTTETTVQVSYDLNTLAYEKAPHGTSLVMQSTVPPTQSAPSTVRKKRTNLHLLYLQPFINLCKAVVILTYGFNRNLTPTFFTDHTFGTGGSASTEQLGWGMDFKGKSDVKFTIDLDYKLGNQTKHYETQTTPDGKFSLNIGLYYYGQVVDFKLSAKPLGTGYTYDGNDVSGQFKVPTTSGSTSLTMPLKYAF